MAYSSVAVQHLIQNPPVDFKPFSTSRDSIVWIPGAKEHYPAHSTWESSRSRKEPRDWWKGVWYKGYIPKVVLIQWVACHNRLNTRSGIYKWGMGQHNRREFCNEEDETVEHLVFQCRFTKEVWSPISHRNGGNNPEYRWEGLKKLASPHMAGEKFA